VQGEAGSDRQWGYSGLLHTMRLRRFLRKQTACQGLQWSKAGYLFVFSVVIFSERLGEKEWIGSVVHVFSSL